jgi:hypothetical protein
MRSSIRTRSFFFFSVCVSMLFSNARAQTGTTSLHGKVVDSSRAVVGDGFFGIDLGLSKRWSMPWNDKQNLALRWEVFNVTNSNRFDFNDQNSSSASESNNSIAVPNFGNYTHLMTNPRVMQFALRYEF